MKFIIAIISTLLLCSCSSNNSQPSNSSERSNFLTETSNLSLENKKETELHSIYLNSNDALNQSYNELMNVAPALLKKNLIDNQKSWLLKRSKACKFQGYSHPKDNTTLSCFIEQNNEQTNVLNQQKEILKDLLDKQFTALIRDNADDYTLDFQANCLCGNIVPYIDSKENNLILNNSCTSSVHEPIIINQIMDMSFNELGEFQIEAINEYGSTYRMSFSPRRNHIYSIILFGAWGTIKDMHDNIIGVISTDNQYTSDIENFCNDFDG